MGFEAGNRLGRLRTIGGLDTAVSSEKESMAATASDGSLTIRAILGRPRAALGRTPLGPASAILLMAMVGASFGLNESVLAQGCDGAWHAVAPGAPYGAVSCMTLWDPDGAGPQSDWLVVGCQFDSTSQPTTLAAWDPSTNAWHALGTTFVAGRSIEALLATSNGGLIAGMGGNVVQWNGSGWTTLVPAGFGGLGGTVFSLAELPNGDVVAGGTFTQINGVAANNIARWDGSAWHPLGAGVTRSPNSAEVKALARMPDGRLVVGGLFVMAGSTSAVGMAMWDGAQWISMGAPNTIGLVNSLAVMPDGSLYASDTASALWHWDGAVLARVFPGPDNNILTLTSLSDGELIAGGGFNHIGGVAANFVARSSNLQWSGLSSGMNQIVSSVVQLPNLDIAAGGVFTTAGGITTGHLAIWSQPMAPGITVQPQDAAACMGGGPLFAVTANGTGPLTYQWELGSGSGTWTALVDGSVALACGGYATATSAHGSGTAIGVTPCAGINHYPVRCTVSNACGATTSNEVVLTVNSADFDGDGDVGTDADIEAFFACLAGDCCAGCGSADFNGDGDTGTDADIEAFFRVLAGGSC